MRVLLKKDFTIEWLNGEKTINANDVGVATLLVETEIPLVANESLWVVFDTNPSVVGDGVTDDILAQFNKVDGKDIYTIPIPTSIIKQAGQKGITCYFQLFIKKSYFKKDGSLDYITRASTSKENTFKITGGLYLDEELDEIVNNETIANLYETAVNKIKIESTNAKDILALQEKNAAQDADITAERTDRQAMDSAISQAANEARSRAEVAVASALDANVQIENLDVKLNEEISSTDSEIRQIQIDLATVKGIEGDFRELDGKVRYSKASTISVSVDPLTYVATFTLHADGGLPISTAQIDLPTEELVIDGYYNEAFGNIVLTLRNGNKIEVSIRDLVDGLISTNQKGAANGVASLDANGKVPKGQLPDDIGGGLPEGFNPDEYLKVGDVNIAVKDGVTKNPLPLTDDEKASACEWMGAVKVDTEKSGNAPFVYTNDKKNRHYLATLNSEYNVYNIPMIYGAVAGKDEINGYLITAVPVNPYHAANKKYVDDLIASLQAQIDALK